MELYLFRHGIAEDAAPGSPDSSRGLTAEGRQKAAAVVRRARRAGMAPTLIASSPYLRAVQTAEIAAKELGWREALVELPSLVPHGTPGAVWSDIRDLRREPAILLAGHQPLLADLAAWLLNAPALMIDMKKSALLRIDFASIGPAPRGVLRWMLVPKLAD